MGDTGSADRSEEGTRWNPLLLLVRGLCWGAVGGGALGLLVLGVIVAVGVLGSTPSSGDITPLVLVLAIGGLVAVQFGAVIGAALGLAGGLALALSGPRAVQRMPRARVITGSVAAAMPLVKAHFFSGAGGWRLGYDGAVFLAVLGAFAAVLLTPFVVQGMPDRRERLLAGAHEPAGTAGGSHLSRTDAQEPRWLLVGRAVSWGVIGGAATGALCWTGLRLGSDRFASVEMVWLALGGAVLGAVLGLAGGLAAALTASEDERFSARPG